MTDQDAAGRTDGDSHPDPGGRSPSAAIGDATLGVSRVRTHRDRHPPTAGSSRDDGRSGHTSREAASFDPRGNREVTHERWKALAFVCFVLVTLALVAETGVQAVAGVDVLALGPGDLGFLRWIDSALATAATRARYVAVAAGGFAVVGSAAATLAVAVRTHA